MQLQMVTITFIRCYPNSLVPCFCLWLLFLSFKPPSSSSTRHSFFAPSTSSSPNLIVRSVCSWFHCKTFAPDTVNHWWAIFCLAFHCTWSNIYSSSWAPLYSLPLSLWITKGVKLKVIWNKLKWPVAKCTHTQRERDISYAEDTRRETFELTIALTICPGLTTSSLFLCLMIHFASSLQVSILICTFARCVRCNWLTINKFL